jgi:hypothetical protein
VNARGAEHVEMAHIQTEIAPRFRKTAETFAAGAKTLPQRYFVSPAIFAQEPSFAKATARQAGYG